ncbi:MAG: hypothetical protein AAGE65_08915 [Planctomycetota bacterium]
MPDARDIAQRIAGWLQAGAIPADAHAASTADAYALLTRRASARLNRCAALLAQGLRTEAVQEADAEPELLREIAALELPNASAWGDACRRHDWPLPETIRPDVAALLNRAYADEALVEPLLREYRLRCVVRAPVRARLAALRALAGVDRGNRPWHDALTELERARHVEIRREVDEALGDVETLQDLRRELRDDRQKVPPPAELIRHVDAALSDGRVARAQRRLEDLLPSLEEAYSAMDFPTCQRLLDDWSQTLKAVGRSALHVPEPLRQRIEPILLWTERQAAAQAADLCFREACDRLAEETGRPGPPEPLRRALDEANAYERPLPGTLGQDAAEALEQRIRLRRRRRNLKWAGVSAAALFAAGTIGLWVINRQTQRDVAERVAEVREAAQANQVELAEERFAALAQAHPSRMTGSLALEAQDALEQARQRDDARGAALRERLAALESAPVETWEPTELLEAQSLARTDAEARPIAELQRRYDDHQARLSRRLNEEALEAVAELRAELNAWDGPSIDGQPDAARNAGRDAALRANRLTGDPRLRPSTSALLAAIAQRADRVVEAADGVLERRRQAAAQERAREALVAVASQPATLAAALRGFAERFPDAADAPAFVRAAEFDAAWDATRAWFELTASWPIGGPASEVQAAERLRSITAYRSEFPDSPWSEQAGRYAAYWGAGLLASAEDGPWRRRLPELMRAPAFRDLGVAETTDGRRFYVVGDADRRETSLGTSVKVALTPDLTRLTAMDFPRGVLGPIRLSPQADLANQLLARLAGFSFARWDTFVIDVTQTVYEADDVDAVLRGLLLGLIFDDYEQAVGALPATLATLKNQLALHADDSANWMDPDDLAAQRAREALRVVFAEPLNFDTMRQQLDAQRDTLTRRVRRRLVGHGLLLRTEQGRSALRVSGLDLREPAALFAVVPDNSMAATWRRVGRRDGSGQVAWDSSAARLSAGSPVWLITDEPTLATREPGP